MLRLEPILSVCFAGNYFLFGSLTLLDHRIMNIEHIRKVRTQYGNLSIGSQVEITRRVKIGKHTWESVASGTVVEKNRRPTSIHTERAPDNHVYVDALILRRTDGEITTVTLDESSEIKILEEPS